MSYRQRIKATVRGIATITAAVLLSCSGVIALVLTTPAHASADSDTYAWSNATYVDANYDWGYSTCPSNDSGCMSMYGYNAGVKYGEADPWVYNLRNCTSYVAEKVYQEFNKNVSNWGNAANWHTAAQSAGYSFDSQPQVGDIADWGTEKAGGYGHVAYVYSVSNNVGSLDEYNVAGTGQFTSNRTTASGSAGAADWYIHMGTPTGSTSQPSTPVALTRDSNDMAVFYNDGNSNLVNWSWNVNIPWQSQQWTDSGGIIGQPAVTAHTSDSMDVFYTTGQGKLVDRSWTASGNWSGPNVLVTGGVSGSPTAIARDSTDMQVFYRDTAGNIKSVSWTASGNWNLNVQTIYGSNAATDPTAITRSSNDMEVFFGKTNGNLVNVGWSSTSNWNAQDWGANAGVTGIPSALTRNGGGNMSAYYQENGNGKVAEQAWDWRAGWTWQEWAASLAGSPSAVPGVSNVVDDFYRETGGNIVDRYFTGSSWLTTNIVGHAGATGNPYAITRGGTNEDVFYWNGANLDDANWNTTSQTWNLSQINY